LVKGLGLVMVGYREAAAFSVRYGRTTGFRRLAYVQEWL